MARESQLMQGIIESSSSDDATILQRYLLAISGNFTSWMGKTIPWVRHEKARYILTENLRCEIERDHFGLLLGATLGVKQNLSPMDVKDTYLAVRGVHSLFSPVAEAGYVGLHVCWLLEHMSLVFIPDLRARAERLGVSALEYFDVHGEKDIDHERLLHEAILCENGMGYMRDIDYQRIVTEVILNLLATIYR